MHSLPARFPAFTYTRPSRGQNATYPTNQTVIFFISHCFSVNSPMRVSNNMSVGRLCAVKAAVLLQLLPGRMVHSRSLGTWTSAAPPAAHSVALWCGCQSQKRKLLEHYFLLLHICNQDTWNVHYLCYPWKRILKVVLQYQ